MNPPERVAASAAPTVLIVEDNLDNRLIYSQYLEHSGYRVVQAGNGEEGIAAANAERPDVILMDISMPVMDGYTATRLLKADIELGSIPIIALTANALVSDEHAALEAGCDAYLAKPIAPRDVRDVVERWLPGARNSRESR